MGYSEKYLTKQQVLDCIEDLKYKKFDSVKQFGDYIDYITESIKSLPEHEIRILIDDDRDISLTEYSKRVNQLQEKLHDTRKTIEELQIMLMFYQSGKSTYCNFKKCGKCDRVCDGYDMEDCEDYTSDAKDYYINEW